MSVPIGIDLGTSKCCVYGVRDGTAALVHDEGASTIATPVACGARGQVVVGAEALRASDAGQLQLIPGLLRILGRRYYSPEIEWLQHTCPYPIVPSPNGDAWIRVGDYDYCPEELVAAVLHYLVAMSEAMLRGKVSGAVIAVPCTMDQHQRRAVAWSCELANLPLTQLVHASSALGHALGPRGQVRRAAVLDLGAGHLEVALLERHAGSWNVVAASGDGILGGLDFDRRLMELLDPTAPYDFHHASVLAERVRHALGSADELRLSQLLRRSNLTLGVATVSREEHDRAIQDELSCMSPVCAQVLEDVALGTDDVDEVLLVGGMTKVPAVVQEVTELFRRAPLPLPDGESLVALGALRCALAHDQGSAVALPQLVTRRIGVKVRGGLVSPIVPRRRRLPWTTHMPFAAPAPGQQRFVFEVYEGDAPQASDNLYLGKFVLEPLLVAEAPTVTFSLDASGMLQIPEWTAGNQVHAVAFGWAGGRKSMPMSRPGQSVPPGETAGERSYARLQRPPIADDFALSGTQVMPAPASGGASSWPPPSEGRTERMQRPKRPSGSMSAVPGDEADDEERAGSDPLVGTLVGDRYVIEDTIAEGAMGRVYLASHRTLGRKFAVKVLHPELANNDELASRFLREAQSASRIESDHVIDIVDFGRLSDGAGYFVMEFLKGDPLRAVLDERGALPADLVRDTGQQVAEGVGAAHEIDIIHRDLKPDNIILVKRRGQRYLCKILDFGIAKHPTSDSGGPITLAGTMVGSPYYMAPEQIVGETVDARTDIYSLGVMLYEMASGNTPFHADSVALLLHKHLEEEPAPLRSHEAAKGYPEALEAVIMRCLAKAPEDRVPSAAELTRLLADAS